MNSGSSIKVKKNKKNDSPYVFEWSNFQSLLTGEISMEALTLKKGFPWSNRRKAIYVAVDNTFRGFYAASDLEDDEKRGRLFLQKKYVDRFAEAAEKSYKKMWGLFRHLKKTDYKNLSNEELIKLLKKCYDNSLTQFRFFLPLQGAGTGTLANEIQKDFDGSQAYLLMQTTEKDLAQKEIEDWGRLKRLKNIKNKNFLKHADKYPWIVAAHFNQEDVLKSLRYRYRNEKNAVEFKNRNNIEKEQREILLKASVKEKQLIDSFHKLASLRLEIKSCWAGLDYYMLALIREIAKRGKEDASDISKYYLLPEIKKLLKSEKLTHREKMERKKCFVEMMKDGRTEFFSGGKAIEVAKRELKSLYKERKVSKIKGVVANPGFLIGKARILRANNKEDVRRLRGEFKAGEVLVSQMTQPNIIDIASRAGAIITDEGGLLSHAAIISREFGIPCIVGTHKATAVLKDGDLVEVDADKGVVRIIKKAK